MPRRECKVVKPKLSEILIAEPEHSVSSFTSWCERLFIAQSNWHQLAEQSRQVDSCNSNLRARFSLFNRRASTVNMPLARSYVIVEEKKRSNDRDSFEYKRRKWKSRTLVEKIGTWMNRLVHCAGCVTVLLHRPGNRSSVRPRVNLACSFRSRFAFSMRSCYWLRFCFAQLFFCVKFMVKFSVGWMWGLVRCVRREKHARGKFFCTIFVLPLTH